MTSELLEMTAVLDPQDLGVRQDQVATLETSETWAGQDQPVCKDPLDPRVSKANRVSRVRKALSAQMAQLVEPEHLVNQERRVKKVKPDVLALLEDPDLADPRENKELQDLRVD